MTATLLPFAPDGAARTAADVVAALGLPDGAGAQATRPRVVAAMIASADGRATVAGRSVGLGHPADSPLLRELRTAVDAILVGTGTLRAEGYANLLDDDQRERRVARGGDAEPIVATIACSGRVAVGVPLFSEPRARMQLHAEAEAPGAHTAAELAVERFAPGGARPPAVLAHLARARGVRSMLCEGGPTLLRALIAETCVDDLMLTLPPLLGAGHGPNVTEGEALHPPVGLALRAVHRAGEHLFLHYSAAP